MMTNKKEMEFFVLGTLLGTTLGVLFAPKSGCETRKCMMNYWNKLDKNKKDEFSELIKDLERDITDFDKEKVLKTAKEKASSLMERVDDLIDMAVENGNETYEKMAEDIRKKAIAVTKSVLNKLEEKK